MRTAPDNCPGTLRVHEAVDGGLVRVRVPGGYLSALQVDALASASAAYGDGSLDLTSRGNLQVRGLRPGTSELVAADLVTAGLLPSPAHDTARNIVASPLTDFRAVVAELDRGLCSSPSLAELPGRFLMALDDGSGDVMSLHPDLALQNGQLVIGGLLAGPGSVADLLDAAEAFLDIRDGEWRVAEIPSGAGVLAAQLGRGLAGQAVVGPPVALGRHGSVVVGLPPLGRLTPPLLARLDEVVVTPWRSLVLPFAVDGFVTDAGSPLGHTTACAGLACAKSLADVRGDALAFPSPRPVHWSGCSRRCGAPTGVLDLVASSEGYLVDGVLVDLGLVLA